MFDRMIHWIATLTLVLGLAMPAPSQSTEPPQGPTPPDDLIKPLLGPDLIMVVKSDLKHSFFDWSTLDKRITIVRRERQGVGSPWSEQAQEISTTHHPVDVRARCDEATGEIKDIWAAIVRERSQTTPVTYVRRYTFAYPTQQPGQYTPLEDRPLPTTTSEGIFSSTTIGRIKALDVDIEGRFVIFVTDGPQRVYQLDLASGSTTVLASSSTLSELGSLSFGSVVVRHHVGEGRMVQLLVGPRWTHVITDSRIVVFPDPNNDAIFSAPQVLTEAEQEARGFLDYDSWLKFCGRIR